MLLRQPNRGNKSNDYIIPAPVMGLNARDSLSAMQPLYAIAMDNYIPLDNSVVLRNGYTNHMKLGEEKIGIRTLVSYNKPNALRMIAIYGGSAYNVTSGDPKKYEVDFTYSRCQTVLYKNRLFFMNGYDKPKVFYIDDEDVEHFEDWGFSAETLSDIKIINGSVSKEFMWFVEKNSLKAWYSSEAGNIQGTLNSFDLSQVSKLGGELIAVANWTIDGGQGIDDLTAFITSEGEVLVYSGINPNDANNWSLKGSYKMSKPIGYQCILPYQGDIVIISEDGYIPMSKALAQNNSGQSSIAFSDAIRGMVLDRTAENKTKEGWQGLVYTKRGYAIFNVPTGQQFEQHVINVNTGAWCRFTGIRSHCWCVFNNNIYFGSDNYVYKYDDGYSDDGVAIEGVVQQAYNNLGTQQIKKIQLLNPRTKCSAKYNLNIYTNMDFEEQKVNYILDVGQLGKSIWNVAKWSIPSNDLEYKWGTSSATKINSQWVGNSATGYNASIVFKTKTKGNKIEWYNTGIRFEVGTGIL